MNRPTQFFTLALITISLSSCFNKNITSINNIEGVWITAKDTSSQFGDAYNIALFIKKESNGRLAVRGCFIRNDEFKMEWKFINVQYDSIAKSISMLDSDLDTLICSLDFENEMLVGAVHSEDETNPINFVRTEKDLTNLFYPQKPDNNGHIIYSYNMPEQIDNYLKTDTIFKFVKDSTSVYKLMEKIINEKFGRLESILIIKDGILILEEYFYGYNRTKLHRINSCTKSVTSL